MAECGVCYEVYEKKGAKCPKLLPCGHSLCLLCLSKTLKHGHIKCPFCRMALQILSGDARSFPTNERILRQNRRLSEQRKNFYANTTGENKNIFTLPSSRQAPRVSCRETGTCQLHRNHEREASCPLHRKTLVRVTAGGTQQRVCESCLDPNFVVLAPPETTNDLDTGQARRTNRETARTDEQNQERYGTSSSARWGWPVICVIFSFVILSIALVYFIVYH